MSAKRVVSLFLVFFAVVMAGSYVLWYFASPPVQQHVYWLVATVIALLSALAAIAQFTGYSLRDLTRRNVERFDETRLRRQRERMLELVERYWIRERLKRLLHAKVPIFLGLTETPEAVERPWDYPEAVGRLWDYEVQTPDRAPHRTRDTSAILDIFRDCGSLLILGSPGSGKTVTLLDLARQLIERAREDGDAPLPVVFVLKSWVQDKKPLDKWMVAQMQQLYQVPSWLGRHWLDRRELLPLLDGLDEVQESAREQCVDAINKYRAIGGAAVVVCSRETQYAELKTRLQVDGAITLQPLKDQQVKQYLRRFGSKTETLMRMLSKNEQLSELARTPLWLDVMTVAYGDVGTTTTLEVTTPADIFDAYIGRVLLSRRQRLEEWSPGQCMHWLRWLAQQMERTEQMPFRLEEIQPDWLGGEVEQRRYRWWLRGTSVVGGLIVGLVSGLIGGLAVGLIGGLTDALVRWLVSGLASGLFLGLSVGLVVGRKKEATGRFIWAATGVAWDWSWVLIFLMVWLGGDLIFQQLPEPFANRLLWLVAAVLCTVVLAQQPVRDIGREVRPNQGMHQSARHGLVVGLVVGLAAWLGILLVLAESGKLVLGLVGGPVLGLWFGLFAGLVSPGGKAAVRHGVLRLRLWRLGLTPMPWRYVAFLEAMTGRLLLDRIGGAFGFTHGLLQKHVASLDDAFIATLDSRGRRD